MASSAKSKKRKTPSQAQQKKPTKRSKVNGGSSFFPFLKLPGELRNAIYTDCRPEGSKKLVRNPRTLRSTADRDWKREALPLAQVNKQIRDEFLPMYWQAFAHTVQFEDIGAYIRTLPKLPKDISGTIVIDVDDEPGDGQSVDVAPLLRLCKKHASLNVHVTQRPGPGRAYSFKTPRWYRGFLNPTNMVERIVASSEEPERAQWLKYVDQAVRELWITPMDYFSEREYATDVRILVKATCGENWMGWGAAAPRCCHRESYTVPDDWLARSGYPGPSSMRYIHVHSSK